MSTSRREFLGRIGAAGVVSLSGLPPAFLRRAAAAADRRSGRGRVLVLVQLAGGNDGLNTVVPFTDPEYYKNRPGIGIGKGAVLKLNGDLGLHPRMGGIKQLYDDGVLAIVQGVGYSKPNRSHFRSMDIWQSAISEKEYTDDGWIGRALDTQADRNAGRVPALSLGTDRLPLTMVSGKVQVPTVRDPSTYRLALGGGPESDQRRRRKLIHTLARPESRTDSSELAFLRQVATTAYTSARKIEEVTRSYRPAASYPSTGLAERMKLIAQLIASDIGTEIFFVSLGGFDTHSAQEGGHAALLAELSGALGAFRSDLVGHKLDDRVLVCTFSEFGRRVKENASLGTDHGAASQLFVLSPNGKGGILGEHPSLTDTERGDLKFHTDFRSVYATILEKWLGYPSRTILGREYPMLEFV